MPTNEEIEKLLSDVRNSINTGCFTCIDRKQNMHTLARLGWLWKDALEEICALSYRDYRQGPMTDRDRPTEDKLWIFKRNVQGEMIYIKFKIAYQKNEEFILISFHFNETP
ncbi:MAG: type II toxin-antitoxin system MqsR family toxin [Clostridiales bacterium]|nr:type II toxin-antitoxin system MqsR family toxin [Clostridiales bacterium]